MGSARRKVRMDNILAYIIYWGILVPPKKISPLGIDKEFHLRNTAQCHILTALVVFGKQGEGGNH